MTLTITSGLIEIVLAACTAVLIQTAFLTIYLKYKLKYHWLAAVKLSSFSEAASAIIVAIILWLYPNSDNTYSPYQMLVIPGAIFIPFGVVFFLQRFKVKLDTVDGVLLMLLSCLAMGVYSLTKFAHLSRID